MHFLYRKLYYAVGLLLIVTLGMLAFLYTAKLHLPPLPFEGMSKKQGYELATDTPGLAFMTEHDGFNWYIYNGGLASGVEELITKLEKAGFSYHEQMGSAYFFTHSNHSDKLVVTSQQWSSKFVIFQLPEEVDLL